MKTNVFIVIGSGRSGTSLATQALGNLGVTLADDQVPASENNLRGTGESITLRDCFTNLKRALGPGLRCRPVGWLDHPETKKTRAAVAEYLVEQAGRAGKFGFAAKFPLSSLYIPLWNQVTTDAGLTPHYIWSTRRISETERSMVRAYSSDASEARIWTMERLFHIFRDAPDDTLLLPFEGWSNNAQEQVDALADLIGQKSKKQRTIATSTFVKSLDHSSGFGDDGAGPQSRIDALVTGKLGQLGGIVDRRSVDYLRMMSEMADTIENSMPNALRNMSEDVLDIRLELLSLLAETTDEDSPEMNEQVEILTTRIREVTAENRDLRRKIANPSNAEAAKPLQEQHAAKLNELSEELEKAKAAHAEVQAAFVRLSQERDRLEAETESRFALKFQDLENREARLRKRVQAQAQVVKNLQRQRDNFRKTVSWRITRPIRFIGRQFKRKKKSK